MTTRRHLLHTAALAAGAAAFPTIAHAAGQQTVNFSEAVNVRDAPFLAKGDGVTDDTAAFQAAMDACGQSGGGTVYAPPGNYLFRANLNIPVETALVGAAHGPTSHNGFRDARLPKPTDFGTTFSVMTGAGDDGTHEPAFLTLNTNSYLSGATIYYPAQAIDAPKPTTYPYAIHMTGKNPTVENIELLNPYQGILAAGNERHTIRNVTGQPLYRGLTIDGETDVGRVENVHFNPWWTTGPPLAWQQANGQAFVVMRSDWQNFTNSFAFGYDIGFLFTKSDSGSCNGTFIGCGIDSSNQAVRVEYCQPYGLLFGECNFTAFRGNQPTHLVCAPTFDGAVKMTNCSFWGPGYQIAQITGTGSVLLSGCDFFDWAAGMPAVAFSGGTDANRPLRVRVIGCEFWQDRPHLSATGQVKGVATANIFHGAAQISANPLSSLVIGDNSEG